MWNFLEPEKEPRQGKIRRAISGPKLQFTESILCPNSSPMNFFIPEGIIFILKQRYRTRSGFVESASLTLSADCLECNSILFELRDQIRSQRSSTIPKIVISLCQR